MTYHLPNVYPPADAENVKRECIRRMNVTEIRVSLVQYDADNQRVNVAVDVRGDVPFLQEDLKHLAVPKEFLKMRLARSLSISLHDLYQLAEAGGIPTTKLDLPL